MPLEGGGRKVNYRRRWAVKARARARERESRRVEADK